MPHRHPILTTVLCPRAPPPTPAIQQATSINRHDGNPNGFDVVPRGRSEHRATYTNTSSATTRLSKNSRTACARAISIAPRRGQTGQVMAETAFLGENLIVWLLLALGGALFAGNLLALVRPPAQRRDEGDLEQAPRGRSIVMAAIGLVVAVAALAALLR